MGNCASPQSTMKGRMSVHRQGAIKIIHLDGKLQEFKQPIKAGRVISSNPSCFLCCSEHMYVECLLPQVPHEEDLHLEQLYYLMPLAQSHKPISLPELCTLAIKASVVLPAPYVGRVPPSSDKNAFGFPGTPFANQRQLQQCRLKSKGGDTEANDRFCHSTKFKIDSQAEIRHD